MAVQMNPIEILPAGDCAVLIRFGHSIQLQTHQRIQQFLTLLDNENDTWMIEAIPAYTTVSITYDPYQIYALEKTTAPFELIKERLLSLIDDLDRNPINELTNPRVVSIPVCYGGEFGPDLEEVAKFHQMTRDDIIALHTEPEYVVYMIGFIPGFPYLGGLSPKLETPRHATPRKRLPKGAVGLAGSQTGIYPFESPGGWQILGRTPIQLFNPSKTSPSLLKSGDRVRFVPISENEFWSYREA